MDRYAKKGKLRLLAWMLSVAMLCNMLPVSAFAMVADESGDTEDVTVITLEPQEEAAESEDAQLQEVEESTEGVVADEPAEEEVPAEESATEEVAEEDAATEKLAEAEPDAEAPVTEAPAEDAQEEAAATQESADEPVVITETEADAITPDYNEDNDTWTTATELVQNVNTYYNLDTTDDVDWFKITTTTPGEGIQIVFSNFDYTVDGIKWYLYSAETLEAGKTTTLAYDTYVGVDDTYTYKADTVGDYYLKIVAYDEAVEKMLKVRFALVAGDDYEINDSWDTATNLPDSYNMEFTLNGANDEDWFYFETSTENEVVNISFQGFETDYSNKITYYVYQATDTGYNTSSLTYSSISITHSTTITCSTVGGYYIRVKVNGTDPVIDPLQLTIECNPLAVDGGEPNDTWLTATTIYEDMAVTYNLPSSTDVDYFKFTTEEDNQTVSFSFYLLSGSGISYALYSEADFLELGDSASSIDSGNIYYSTSDKTARYMLSDAGTYYIRIKAYNSSYTFEDDATITYTLIEPDDGERNNTWQTATVINEDVATEYTLPADNDIDFFKIVTTVPNQTIYLSFYLPSDGGIYYTLYSEADFWESGDSASSIDSGYIYDSSSDKTVAYMVSDAGTYYVRVKAYNSSYVFEENGSITYTLIEPDDGERNNTWQTATVLNEGVEMEYTLPADNDIDYFEIVTTEPNQTVNLEFSLPSGGGISYLLYSESDFWELGDSASSIDSGYIYDSTSNKTVRYMFSDAGTYYVRVKAYSHSRAFEENGSITYTLIDPDVNEYNNTVSTATSLTPQTPTEFTIPADNDVDYFLVDTTLTAGDTITVTLEHTDTAHASYTVALYYMADGETSASFYSSSTVSSGSSYATKTFTISNEGTYYIRISTIYSPYVDTVATLKYTVQQEDVDVTGISIENGDATVFENKTYSLYATITPGNAYNQNVTWVSSDISVATVDAYGTVTAISAGTATISATTEQYGYGDSTTITVIAPILVTGISLQPSGVVYDGVGDSASTAKTLALGSSLTMLAEVVPDNATEREIVWSVSDDTVLAVTSEGKVYAVGSGTACVTATTNDLNIDTQYSASYWINVPDESYPVLGVSLNLNAATLYVGEEGIQLTASVYPSYADNTNITWSSENSSIATVDSEGNVTAVSAGYTTIIVTTEENAYTAECTISVQPERVRVSSIEITNDGIIVPDGSSISLGLYGTLVLSSICTPTDATDQTVSWSSNNTTVVSVSRTGVVTAIGTGTAVITVTSTDGAYTDSIVVQVSLSADLGDVTNDGNVDVADALYVLQASVGSRALTTAETAVADVNGDNYIDAADAILILRYNAGLISSFPAEES